MSKREDVEDYLEDTKEFPKVRKSKRKWIIISIIILMLISVVVFIFMSPFKLKKGDIKLSYGKKYKEPGYSALKYGHDYTKKVKVSNNINYKKLGEYKVRYKVKIGFINYEAIRKVDLIDDEKPVITLKGNKETDVCPSKKYEEEGYEAKDNYDGDLTRKVKTIVKDDSITYSVSDSSKNKAKIIRKLTYQDKVAPEIKLNGEEKVSITAGNSFTDPLASATDNCDGDISSNIVTEGSVDSNTPGEYTITYKIKDSSENEISVQRTVTVLKKSSLNDGRPGTIYLTFDDGPNQGTTNVILDILREEGVPATFFVTNNGPDYLIKREYDEGHTVALHTATHDYATVYASDDAYYRDLYSVQARVRNITGYNSTIIRFPGGSSNTVSRRYSPGIMSRLSQSTLAKGFKYYDWNISSGDAGGTTIASGVYNNVVSSLRKDRVNMILMHDIKPYTRDAIRNIIRYGKEAGYSFEKITMDTPMITQGVNN
ncbi:MAG: polysaccharide deacetylase family protein [Bacilli bacterium]|nr:polysaccharide deacetylase family protein [Bacilli bacterium]